MASDKPGRPLIVSLGGINMDLVAFADRLPADGETVVGSRFITYAGGKGLIRPWRRRGPAAVASARRWWAGWATICSGRNWRSCCIRPGLTPARWGLRRAQVRALRWISVGEDSQNRIVQVLGANDTCGDAEYDAIAARLPETAAVLLQLEVSVDLSLRVAEAASSQGVMVILDPGPVRAVPADFYRHLSVITPNETEAEALVGYAITAGDSVERAAQELLNRGAGAVVITLGAQGAYWSDGAAAGYAPSFPATAGDTVGAGDAFNGALAVALGGGEFAAGCGAPGIGGRRAGGYAGRGAGCDAERAAIEGLLAAHPTGNGGIR